MNYFISGASLCKYNGMELTFTIVRNSLNFLIIWIEKIVHNILSKYDTRSLQRHIIQNIILVFYIFLHKRCCKVVFKQLKFINCILVITILYKDKSQYFEYNLFYRTFNEFYIVVKCIYSLNLLKRKSKKFEKNFVLYVFCLKGLLDS